MVRNEHDQRPTCLRRETERALEEAIAMGLDPRKEYHLLVRILRRRFATRVSKLGRALSSPK